MKKMFAFSIRCLKTNIERLFRELFSILNRNYQVSSRPGFINRTNFNAYQSISSNTPNNIFGDICFKF